MPRFENTECKLVSVLFATFGLMLWADAAAATLAGMVVAVSGTCTDHGRVLDRGDAVQVGDTLDVPAGGNLKLQMTDRSVISVAADSNITVVSYSIDGPGRNVRLSLTRGALRAQVTSITDTSTFEIATAAGTASVASASADWFVESQRDAAQVAVLTGTIDLRSALTGDSVSIPARWGTLLETGLDPVLPRVWAQREFNAVIRLTGT